MMTVQHVLGTRKNLHWISVVVLKNVAYITFLKSIPHSVNGIMINTEQHPFMQSTRTYCKVQGRKKWEKGSHMQIVTIYQHQHMLTQTWKYYEPFSETRKFTNASLDRKRGWGKALKQLQGFLCEKHLSEFLMLVFCNVCTTLDSVLCQQGIANSSLVLLNTTSQCGLPGWLCHLPLIPPER